MTREALAARYRSIDTAQIHANEAGVGRAIAASGVPRADLFVTTKVWNTSQGLDATKRAFETSLEKLGGEYLDLHRYVVHWPSPKRGKFVETWRTLVEPKKEGRVRAIGVSNFGPAELSEIIEATGEKSVGETSAIPARSASVDDKTVPEGIETRIENAQLGEDEGEKQKAKRRSFTIHIPNELEGKSTKEDEVARTKAMQAALEKLEAFVSTLNVPDDHTVGYDLPLRSHPRAVRHRPGQGLAVTLIIGIIAGLVTGVFCTRLDFEHWVRGAKVKRLSVGAESAHTWRTATLGKCRARRRRSSTSPV